MTTKPLYTFLITRETSGPSVCEYIEADGMATDETGRTALFYCDDDLTAIATDFLSVSRLPVTRDDATNMNDK